MNNIITGKVVLIQNKNTIVINKGSHDGVKEDNRFLVYRLGDELFDPDTKESLGTLELICGEGKPVHIQERMTTLISDKFEERKNKTVVKRNSPLFFSDNTEETYKPETIQLPFENIAIDALVRQIK